MLSFIRPPGGDLSTGDEWVQIGLRFSGPLLLAQMALAVRDRRPEHDLRMPTVP